MKPFYDHKGIAIYHGDARIILPRVHRFDVVFTSPPYNKREPGRCANYPAETGTWRSPDISRGYGSFHDDLSLEDYHRLLKTVFGFAFAALPDQGGMFINHKPQLTHGAVRLPTELFNFPLRQIIIWNRKGCINFSHRHFAPAHEWIMLFAKAKFRLRNRSASKVSDCWTIAPQQHIDHPCPYPVELPLTALAAVDFKCCLDPFMGSGTTALACKKLGRKFIGIELEKKWCQLAVRRLESMK